MLASATAAAARAGSPSVSNNFSKGAPAALAWGPMAAKSQHDFLPGLRVVGLEGFHQSRNSVFSAGSDLSQYIRGERTHRRICQSLDQHRRRGRADFP